MKLGLRKFLRFLKYALLFIIALIFLFLLLLSQSFSQFKAFYNETLAGKYSLESAITMISSQNLTGASVAAEQASVNFTSALDELKLVRANWLIKTFVPASRQIDDLAYVDQSGLLLSEAMVRGLRIAGPINEIISKNSHKKFSEFSSADKGLLVKMIYESEPEIIKIKADVDLAAQTLNKIPKFSVLYPVYPKISDLKIKLKAGQELLGAAIPMIRLAPVLLGYPETSRYLLLLQNNDELRPTGGFLGTYGTLEVSSGEIKNLVTEDTYHLDMPVKDTLSMEPPVALKKYLKVEKWFLRDSNWSPDWPTSARDIQNIYGEELKLAKLDNPGFTGIIAITPDFIADLIDLVGPITVKGQTYNKDNFQKLLQYNVEVAYKTDNISSWDRKEIINDIIAELKNRLFNLSLSRYQEFFSLLNRNLEQKNILVYFNNTSYENLIADFAWAGKVKTVPSDYLMVVDANLAAFKSDAVMTKNINYALNFDSAKNSLTAKLKLFYRHNGGYDWRTTRYQSFTRVYLPRGSKLINMAGQAQDSLNVYEDPELDKTVVAFYFTVDPGTEKEIALNYELPAYVREQATQGNYALYVQKQAGRRTNEVQISLDIKNKITKYTSDLLSDKSFNLGK